MAESCEHCGHTHSEGEYVCPVTQLDRTQYLIHGLQNEDPVADLYFLVRYGGARHVKFRTQDIFYQAFISALEAEISEEARIEGPDFVRLVRDEKVLACVRQYLCQVQPLAYFRFRCRYPDRSLKWIATHRLPQCLYQAWRR